jgi:predicted nucleic acid-binding protein
VVSTQVLQELYNNLTRKFGTSPSDAAELVRDLRQLEVVVVTVDVIDDAMQLHAARQTSFWDSLILCAAASARCQTLYSEDMPDGETIRGVRIVNPFRSA